MKVMTVIGTRPEIIRLSRVMAVLDREMEHIIVHTGQNYDYELNQIFFDDLEIRKPDHFLQAAGTTAADTIGQIISRVDEILKTENPNALLVLGDTNSCLSAYPAKRRKIPVYHMEAGNRCFDQRVPEEINRKIIDHISDINMPYSKIAREYLLREGISPDRVIKTGSPMYEVIYYYLPKIQKSTILDYLDLKPDAYFIVSCHREENVESDPKLNALLLTLNGLADEYGHRIIFTTHPRTRKRIENTKQKLNRLIELHKPFGFTDYVKLELNAITVLSDSGTITEESSILNFPSLNIRQTHERPEGMEEGSVMMVGLDWVRVKEGINILKGQLKGDIRNLDIVKDYHAPNVSEKVLRIIQSYTDYINRTVWYKSN